MLSVLNVAYPFAAVDPDPLGGAEQVLALIDVGLVRERHRSLVIARDDSRPRGELIPVPRTVGLIGAAERRRAALAHRAAIADTLRRRRVDVVHLHGIDFLDYLPDTDRPVVVTLHLPPSWYPPEALSLGDRVHLICVSESQRRACGAGAAIAEVVPNGVPLERYRPRDRRDRFALLLGRVCPEKGFHIGLRVARRAGVPLLCGGPVYPYEEHLRYFERDVAPLFDCERRYLGPVSGARKAELLARARCVLVTSQVDETSSLVAMEALASGTPVVGFRRGALPELVESGVTGFLVDSEEEMAEAILWADRLHPGDCRRAAEARASADRMVARYLDLYRRLAGPPPRARRAPARVEVELLRDDAGLAALDAPWRELCDRSPDATPFQRPEWQLAWRRHLRGGELCALLLRRAGRLVGLLPLELRQRGGRRALVLTGSGASDYLDAIVEPGIDLAPIGRALAALRSWDVLDLQPLRPGSPLLALEVPGCPGAVEEVDAAPVLALPAALPRRVATDRRRLARAGAAEWLQARPHEVPALLGELFRLHAARWSARGEEGVLAHPSMRALHEEVAPALARRGLLRLLALTLDGEVIAVLYSFGYKRRIQCYLCGFDPARAALSPGALLIGWAIERAMGEGARELDFLRGREPYKYSWGALDRPLFRRTVRRA